MSQSAPTDNLQALVDSIEASLRLRAEVQSAMAQATPRVTLPLAELAAFAKHLQTSPNASHGPKVSAIIEGGYYALERLGAQHSLFEDDPEAEAIQDCLDAFAALYEPPHDQMAPNPDSLSDYVFKALTQP